MNKKQKWILRISIIINCIFLFFLFINYNAYSDKIGMLNRDIKVGEFEDKSVLFKLPKGLMVRDVSERGISAIGLFENHRFEIVVTTDDDSLVDYNIAGKNVPLFGNVYSADNHK